MYDANDLNDTNTNVNLIMQMPFKMQMQTSNVIMQMLLKIQMQILMLWWKYFIQECKCGSYDDANVCKHQISSFNLETFGALN